MTRRSEGSNDGVGPVRVLGGRLLLPLHLSSPTNKQQGTQTDGEEQYAGRFGSCDCHSDVVDVDSILEAVGDINR